MPEEMIQVIEGLALSTPRRSIATIHRQVCEMARQQEWVVPSYGRVYQIIGEMSPVLKLWAEKGAKEYRGLCCKK